MVWTNWFRCQSVRPVRELLNILSRLLEARFLASKRGFRWSARILSCFLLSEACWLYIVDIWHFSSTCFSHCQRCCPGELRPWQGFAILEVWTPLQDDIAWQLNALESRSCRYCSLLPYTRRSFWAGHFCQNIHKTKTNTHKTNYERQ